MSDRAQNRLMEGFFRTSTRKRTLDLPREPPKSMNKIATSVIKKVAGSHAQQYEPTDPAYENYTDAQGKQRRKRREVPLGLSKRDAKILKKVRSRAHRLDKGFSLCGFKFGTLFFLALIPIVGDVLAFLISYRLVIHQAMKADLPNVLKQRMIANQLLASGVGLIPLLGDVIMAVIKPNSCNSHLLEAFLVERAALNTASGVPGQEVQNQAAARTVEQSKWWNFSKRTGDPASATHGPIQASSTSNGNAANQPARPSQQQSSVPARQQQQQTAPVAATGADFQAPTSRR